MRTYGFIPNNVRQESFKGRKLAKEYIKAHPELHPIPENIEPTELSYIVACDRDGYCIFNPNCQWIGYVTKFSEVKSIIEVNIKYFKGAKAYLLNEDGKYSTLSWE